MSQQQQRKAGYKVTPAGSNTQTAFQEHLKNIFFQEKELKKKAEGTHGPPTFQRAAAGLLPALQQGSFQVFHLHVLPTHTQPASFCMLTVCSHAQAAFSCSPTSCGSWILHIISRPTHFVIVSACVWASVCMCVICLRVPGWCGQSGYFGSLI